MKKVCVLLATPIAGDSRAQRTARCMARHAEVDIYFLAGPPGTKVEDMPRKDGIRLYPLHYRPRLKDRVLRRSLFFLATAEMSDAVEATGTRYDVVYAHDLPTACPALRLARRQGARIIYDVHDLVVETINQSFPRREWLPKRLLHSIEQAFMRTTATAWERRFMRKADLVMTVTDGCLRYLEERYGLKGGLVLHNYPEFREVVRTEGLHRACGVPPGKSIALYHGSLGPGRYLESIVRSAEYLAEENVLVVLGNGPMESGLKALAARPDLRGKVFFHNAVPYDDLLPLASAASLGLVLIEPINLSKRFALANKLTECMAAGVPVLASDSTENRRVLQESDAGYLCPLMPPMELGARINELMADKADLARKGENGKRAFRDRFHWEVGLPAFEQAFLKLIEAT